MGRQWRCRTLHAVSVGFPECESAGRTRRERCRPATPTLLRSKWYPLLIHEIHNDDDQASVGMSPSALTVEVTCRESDYTIAEHYAKASGSSPTSPLSA